MVVKLERALEEFFFCRREMPAFAICRIGFGLCILIHSILLVPNFKEIFGSGSLFGFQYFEAVKESAPTSFTVGPAFALLKYVSTDAWITAAYAILMVASALFVFGLQTRMSGAVLTLMHVIFLSSNSFAYWGWGAEIIPFIIYVIFSPAAADYSWRGRLNKSARSYPVWPMRLMQIHISALYFTVAWSRLPDQVWRNGRALQLMLVSAVFGRIDSSWIEFRDLLVLLTYLSWTIELVAPVLLWIPRTRRLWAFLLIALHLNLELLTGVGLWNLLMISALSVFAIDLDKKQAVHFVVKTSHNSSL